MIPLSPEGAAYRAALRGDCHTPLRLVRRRRADRADGPHRDRARPRVHGAHRPLAPPHGRPRPHRASGCVQQLDVRRRRSTTSSRRSASSPASRSTSSRTARSTRTTTCSPRSTSWWPACTRSCAWSAQPMTERMVLAVASPHVDILGHCTGRNGRGQGSARVDVRRRARVRGVRAVRQGGRDQLPARAPRPAAAPARAGGRMRLQGSRSTPTPTPPASSSGSLTAATGRPSARCRSSRSSTRWTADDLLEWAGSHG